MKNQVLNEGIALLPIDRNNNGLLDETENVYGDLKQLIRGIWIGKYPKALTTSIYAAGINPPEGEASVAFMKWILTDGQKFLYDNGYNDLLLTERQRSLENLYEAKVYTAVADKTRSPFVVLLILFTGSVALVLLTDRLIRFARKSKAFNAVPQTSECLCNSKRT